MADNGYVYVLINPSIKNLVKIGKTTREPEERAKELSSTTGVPTPFVVVYSCYFESCSAVEVFVHKYLESKGYRVSQNREFFEIPVKDAIDSVMKAKEQFGEFEKIHNSQAFDEYGNFSSNIPEEPWEEILNLGDVFYYGLGDEIQDYDEAINYYSKAIMLGSSEACLKIGLMYKHGVGVNIDATKAMQYFKEGAKKGDASCFGEMAITFLEEGNVANTLKCWNKYFDLTDKVQEKYGLRYMVFIYEYQLDLDHKDKLKAVKKDIISWQNQSITEYYDDEFLVEAIEENIRIVNSFFEDGVKKVETGEIFSQVVDNKKKGFFRFFT